MPGPPQGLWHGPDLVELHGHDIFPNTIDYWGPTGMVFYRNQQARYSFHG
jgi:hypothetical protein